MYFREIDSIASAYNPVTRIYPIYFSARKAGKFGPAMYPGRKGGRTQHITDPAPMCASEGAHEDNSIPWYPSIKL